ncbi:MAG: hypothetical protein ACOZJX_21870 [Pseudomonadota bacterium]
MKPLRDEIHDSLVATYQSLEARVLNRVLLANGVTEPGRWREIIASFLFEQGVVLDQCWFEEHGQRWFPGVYFATTPHEGIEDAAVYLPSEQYGMNFHEYAHGAADWALENEGEPDAIPVGTP